MENSRIAPQRTSELPEMGSILQGRYRLQRVVGLGGMGIVVEAYHLQLERPVAIKLMHRHLVEDADFLERFKREMLIAKQIEHPNTVRIYDSGVTEAGAMYLVMEFLEGMELKQLIAQGPLSFRDVHELALQILDGLAEAHALNIVHRDLKPGNIFVSTSRRGQRVAKVLDFGIAKSLEAAQQNITATGSMVGTGPYLAPELFLQAEFTKSADIYACGLILFEMVTGRRLIDAPSLGQTMSLHLHMPVILPDPLSAHPLGVVIQKALSKSPRERFQDADAMIAALRQCSDKCGDTRLAHADIDAAFDKMQAGFADHADTMLPGMSRKPNAAETMMLDASDVELLDSASLSVPFTPANPTSAMTSVIRPQASLKHPQRNQESDPQAVVLDTSKTHVFAVAFALTFVALIGVMGWYFLSGENQKTEASAESDEATAPLMSDKQPEVLPIADLMPDEKTPSDEQNLAIVPQDDIQVQPEKPEHKAPDVPEEQEPDEVVSPPKKRPKPATKKPTTPVENPFENVLRRHL